ncbi:hypothetical protein QL285_093312 [Trifolium repens]|nr:hypothetical protein QL285_093312 [Trifolium repens]
MLVENFKRPRTKFLSRFIRTRNPISNSSLLQNFVCSFLPLCNDFWIGSSYVPSRVVRQNAGHNDYNRLRTLSYHGADVFTPIKDKNTANRKTIWLGDSKVEENMTSFIGKKRKNSLQEALGT